MTEPNPKTDPEDELAGTEQPFVAHLMELRDRLIKALVAVGVVAGVLALSTYLPLADTLAGEASEANRDVPIFMAHGVADPVIPHDFARRSADQLTAAKIFTQAIIDLCG